MIIVIILVIENSNRERYTIMIIIIVLVIIVELTFLSLIKPVVINQPRSVWYIHHILHTITYYTPSHPHILLHTITLSHHIITHHTYYTRHILHTLTYYTPSHITHHHILHTITHTHTNSSAHLQVWTSLYQLKCLQYYIEQWTH